MHHAFKLEEVVHNLELSRSASGYRLHLNDQFIAVDLSTAADGRTWLTVADRHIEVCIAVRGDDVFIHLDGETFQLRYQHPLDRLAAASSGSGDDQVLAPMPGNIISVSVKAGDTVSKGQVLLVMESMKMETTISASRDGVIAAVSFEAGQSFDRDALLLSLEPVEMPS